MNERLEPDLTIRVATAVYAPPRPPADRRLTDVRRIDQPQPLPEFSSLEAWEARRQALRQQLLAAAGLLPEPTRTPLDAQFLRRTGGADYTVENVAFQSRPGLYVTGNLYRPVGAAGRRPALLNPHGHTKGGRLEHSENNSTIARCMSFARQGYVAFAYDMVGYNDARQLPHHFGDARDWLWGLSALGLQLWNSVRALDFLLSLPDVDPERLGCVGESGGGTQTFLLAAVDARVRYVAPVVMVSAHYQGGCVCENAPNLRLETSNVEIAAMAAPRPMILVSATGDWTCNTPTVEYPAIKRIYDLYGAGDRLCETQIAAPHNFNQASREAVYRFFSHWFRGTPLDQPHPEAPLTAPEREVLRVFPEQLPADALDATGVRRAQEALAGEHLAAAWPRDAASLVTFRGTFAPVYHSALAVRPVRPEEVISERLGEHAFAEQRAIRLLLGSGRGERLPALFFAGPAGGAGQATVLLHAAGKAAFFEEIAGQVQPGPLLRALLAAGRPVLLVDLFLTGDYRTPLAQSGRDQSSPHFSTFNRSDVALRCQDVVTAVAAARQLHGAAAVDLVAIGDAGLWAVLARPLSEGVATLVASGARFIEDDRSYLERLYVPGLRRAGGLATALALAAPAAVHLFAFPADGISTRLTALYAGLGQPGRFRTHGELLTEDRAAQVLSASEQ